MVYDEMGNQLFDGAGEPLIKPEMKKKYRNPCKMITFGLLYGAGPGKLSSQLKISMEEAKELIAKYFKVFPKVKQLMDNLSNTARRTKMAVSPLDGRQIDLSAIDWDDKGYVAHALNQAKNLPFQGTGASVTKLALCYINKRLKANNFDADIVNVVHDEILVECHKDVADQVKVIVEEEMIRAFNFYCPDVKMAVVAEVGTHWIH
jgi:DNA polymerase-1